MTSLDINPIRCAFVLCHFGQVRNGSLVTHFNSTARSSARNECIAVPEHVRQNGESDSRNEERFGKKVSLQTCTQMMRSEFSVNF